MHSSSKTSPLTAEPDWLHRAADPVVLRFEPQPPARERLAQTAGFNLQRPVHARKFETALSDLPAWLRLAHSRGTYRILRVETLETGRMILADGSEYRGAIGQFLKHVQFVAPFVVSIGSGLERLARCWLRDGKLLGGTIVDALASELVEDAADQLQQRVRDWAQANGKEITPRYSPGYCGLSLKTQQTLFKQVDARGVNVRLTDSQLMLPLKSVSGLIGIGPADLVSPEGYPCTRCDHPDCMMRRADFAGADVCAGNKPKVLD